MEKTEYRMNYRGELYSPQEYEDTFHISLLRKFASAGLILPDFNDLQPVEVEEDTDINKLKQRLKFLYKDENNFSHMSYTGWTGYTGTVGYTGSVGYSGISSSTTTYSTTNTYSTGTVITGSCSSTGSSTTVTLTGGNPITTQFISIQNNPIWE